MLADTSRESNARTTPEGRCKWTRLQGDMGKLRQSLRLGVSHSLQKQVLMAPSGALSRLLTTHFSLSTLSSHFLTPTSNPRTLIPQSSVVSWGNEKSPSHFQVIANASKAHISQFQMPCTSQKRAPGPQLQEPGS